MARDETRSSPVGALTAVLGLGLAVLGGAFGARVLVVVGLLLAVGPWVVGRLARRWRRRLHWTTEGKVYCGLTVLIGAAAINTGANLLFLLVGLLLSLIVISGILSETTLRGLDLELVVPDRVHRDRPTTCTLVLHNGKRFLPTFSVSIEVPDEAPVHPDGSSPWIPALGPGETARIPVSLVPEERGPDRIEDLRVSTRFPFHLFEKVSWRPVETDLLVLPTVRSIRVGAGRVRRTEGAPPRRRTVATRGEEFRTVREYRPGDSPRLIHWRSTARRGELVVKELEPLEAPRATVVLDPRPGPEPEAFERACDLAASLVVDLVRQGARPELVVGEDGGSRRVVGGGGRGSDLPLLRALARARTTDEAPGIPAGGPELRRGTPPLLVTARPARSVAAPGPVRVLSCADPTASASRYRDEAERGEEPA